ncbi:MAG: hypothetical protein KDA16_09720 [Phycisphaerales bacterium]|nr:hypothetical protein [Phycisphaerales bacterium]
MIRTVLVSGLMALVVCAHASAQTTWSGVLSEESFEIQPDEDDPNIYTDHATIAVAMPGTFSFDFSSAGETEITVTWTAPPGQFIEIAVPADAISAYAGIDFDGKGGSVAETSAVSLEFFGASGSPLPAADVSDMDMTTGGPNTSIVWIDLVPGETYRFQSITGTATFSDGVDFVITDQPFARFEIFGYAELAGDGTNNPGQWVRLVTPSCPGDVNGDMMVDVDDLNAILSAWGTNVGAGDPRDLANNDGIVDVDDLNVVLGNWGNNCP